MEAQAIQAVMLSTTSISRIENPQRRFPENEERERLVTGVGGVAPFIV
jgi:hypothetical protein